MQQLKKNQLDLENVSKASQIKTFVKQEPEVQNPAQMNARAFKTYKNPKWSEH